ncbi:iron-containing alcohol dehydrogenase [Celerinatantimonas sp. MCCC 1A17872]|uniref:iron-containing alcohol dehydrogenase n=1 Tax=Celerinatantimonas sp. MCCC 1A17872 TaxID=3177514 RepID=UPI0038CBB539
MSSQIVLPRIMEVGKGASLKVPQILQALNVHSPLIVTDKMMVKLGYVQTLEDSLKEAGIHAQTFSDTIPEPTASSIQAGVQMVRAGEFDSVIALGGGSPIDSAKAISVVGKFGGNIRDYKFPKDVNEAGLPIIAIPTTAGTGSENTRVSVITDDVKGEKMMCQGLGLMPSAAIIDYALTTSLPPRVTADCGLDALTHAIESYVSRKKNTFSSLQALNAMELIGKNLKTAYHEPDNEAAREAMMLGASLAGIAFSNASVGLVHGMSRPIGAFFHVPHGLSNAMLLPAITQYSIVGNENRYAQCAIALGFCDANDDVSHACQKLIDNLRSLTAELKVPTPKDYGINEKEYMALLAIMAQQAQDSGSPANNPRVPSIDEMVELYKQVWDDQH